MKKNKKLFLVIFFIFFIYTFDKVIFYNPVPNIQVGFSPGKTAQNLILDAIKDAHETIDIAAYSFTSKDIIIALINAKKRGIKIRIVADKKSNSGKDTAITYLVNAQIPVKLNNKYSIMHHKFMIIDNTAVQTGSFNYTKNANIRNAENVLYLKNMLNISKKYKKEFIRLWNESILIEPKY